MDQSQITLSQALRNSEPVRPSGDRQQQQPRDDSAWRISVLSTLGPARSSEPAFGTMYSKSEEPLSPTGPQHNMRLVIKKESALGEKTSDYKGQYRVRDVCMRGMLSNCDAPAHGLWLLLLPNIEMAGHPAAVAAYGRCHCAHHDQCAKDARR